MAEITEILDKPEFSCYHISMGEKKSCSLCEGWYLSSDISNDAAEKYPNACRDCIFAFIDWWNNRYQRKWDDGIEPHSVFSDEQIMAEFLLNRLLNN